MPGLTRRARAELEELARNHPDLMPLPLADGSRQAGPLSAVMVGPDGLVLVDHQFRPGATVTFDQIEHASVTEDVGTRYEVELALAGEGDDPRLCFDSRVQFAMLFAALRSHQVACRFAFSESRQRGDSAENPAVPLRTLVGWVASATALAVIWQNAVPNFFKDRFSEDLELGPLLVISVVISVVAIAPFGIYAVVFKSLYNPRSFGDSFPLMAPVKAAEPTADLDDQPLGAAMIASETYKGVGQMQPAVTAEEKQISDIERLLD